MNSIWPSALASLDRSVAPFDAVLQKLEAAQPVDVTEVTRQLNAADEHAHKLRTMLLADLPQAEWSNREELGVLVAKRDIELQRSRLSSLADELQHGNIVHRRAARVTQLNELRDNAVNELRSFAEQPAAPPVLPGPDANHWVEWACGLKEPDDAESLQSLRSGFLYLDEFVASIEPGMWTVDGRPSAPAEPPIDAGDAEERRARLLALAGELEHGNIVHHRGIRVAQVSQLRENAIVELRSLAETSSSAPTLPGPEADQWVQWASSLKEPDDIVPLHALRKSFVHLDEFVANLEPGMWVPLSSAPAVAVAAAAAASAATVAKAPDPVVYTAPSQPRSRAAAVVEEAPIPRETAYVTESSDDEGHDAASTPAAWLVELWAARRNIIIAAAAVLIIAVFGAVRWKVHRTNANSEPVKAVEASTSTVTPAPATETSTAQPAVTTAALKEPASKSKAEDSASKPAPTPPAEKQPQLLGGATPKAPQAIPNKNAPKPDDAAPPTLAAMSGPGPGMPGNVMNIVKSVPTAPKVKASSGVAEGQLVHRVTPSYPQQARLSGIQGTVTVQALIGKDGKVQSVKVLKGPAMLTQAAVDAVKQWQYKPFLLNGEPAEADVQISLNFTP